MLSRALTALCVLSLFLSGCSLTTPDYNRPSVQLRENWKEAGDARYAQDQRADWWVNFNSATLNQMVALSLQQNNNLQAALARVEQARAQAKITGANALPTLDAGTSTSNGRDTISGGGDATRSRQASLSLGYELDLFGGNAAERKAAIAALKAAGFDKDAAALLLSGDVANAYFTLLQDDWRIAIAKANVTNQQDVLKIIEARFAAGSISGLELAQQKSALASAKATLAVREQARKQDENTLSILLGNVPQTIQATDRLDSLSAPTPTLSKPAMLLDQRPDIRAAEQRLIAANADIGAARATLFPTLNLGAGLLAASIGGLGSEAINITSSLLAPIFRGGALQGGVALSEARKKELVANYRQTVLAAFGEVENALAAQKGADERARQFTLAEQEAAKAYDLSRRLYDAGSIDFLDLLDAQRTLYTAQDNLAVARLDALTATVDLYRATAGGF